MKLPYPEFSDGVSLWDVDETTIKKSYRKVSLRVHPDKNRKHEDVARAAFECKHAETRMSSYRYVFTKLSVEFYACASMLMFTCTYLYYCSRFGGSSCLHSDIFGQ